jgi:ABC-2 type transport system ATP-binding protein
MIATLNLSPGTNAAEVQSMHRSCGGTVGLDDVSCTVREGEIFAIPGADGVGKTSTVECIQAPGILGSGRVSVAG